MSELIPDIQLQDNTEQRLACVLVLDGSSSMYGEKIDKLNEGLKSLEQALKDDDAASSRVQILVIRIGGNAEADIITDWTDAMNWQAPTIEANGMTPLGSGAKLGLQSIEEQKKNYQANGISYNRPWMILISDGEPNDSWEKIADDCREAENKNKVTIFPIGVEGADMQILSKFSNKSAIKLEGLQFNELFIWLSKSLSTGSQASAGEKIQLPAVGWGEVSV